MSFLKRNVSLKDKLQNIFSSLRSYHNKIALIKNKLQLRERELFDKVIKAKQYNKEDLAVIFANEVAEIRKLQKNLEGVSLAIEQLILRIETLMQIEEFTGAIAATKSLVQSIKDKVSQLSPELGAALEELSNNIEGINLNYPEYDIFKTGLNEEAESVLKEAAREAAKAKEIELPEIPLYQDKRPVRMLEAEGYSKSQEIPVLQTAEISSREINVSTKEERLLRYIMENKGKIDINKCSKELGMSSFEIKSLLDSLSKQGKIEIVRK